MESQKNISRRAFLGSAAALLASSPGWARSTSQAPLWDGARFAFLSSGSEPRIVAVDVDKGRIETKLELPFVPSEIAVSQNHNLLIAANPIGQSVGFIDLVGRQYLGAQLVGLAPDVVQISPGGDLVAYGGRDGRVSVWNLRDNTVLVQLRGLGPIDALTFSRDGRGLFFVDRENMQLCAIDLREGEVGLHINLPGTRGGRATAMSRSLDGMAGYISLTDDNKVVEVDFFTMSVSRVLEVKAEPKRPYVSGDGRFVLIPHEAGRAVSVISAATSRVVETIQLDHPVSEVVTGWLESCAFAMPAQGSKASVVDLVELSMTRQIDLGGDAGASLVNSDTRVVITPVPELQDILLIDTSTQQIAKTLSSGLADLQPPQMGVSGNICH